jgi:acyl-CoA thioesterase
MPRGNPLAKRIGLHFNEARAGFSRCWLAVDPHIHMNPNGVVHGAVLYAMADTGMGAALMPLLDQGLSCATIEIKMSYFRPVYEGELVCTTEVVNKGRTIANLESRVYCDDKLIAQANGNYAIFQWRTTE